MLAETARRSSANRGDLQAGDFDRGAAVHHDLQSGGLGTGGGGLVDHAQLHPHRLGADRDRLIDDRADRVGAAEDIDDVDRVAQLVEVAEDEFAVQVFAGDLRIDRITR